MIFMGSGLLCCRYWTQIFSDWLRLVKCQCCYYGEGKGIGWYVQVKISETVDKYCKHACHGSKGKTFCLAALAFKFLKAGSEKTE